MEIFLKTVGAVVMILLAGAAVAVIVAFPVMLLWDAVMPDIFGLKEITFWQALGLSVLSNLLLKSTDSSKNKE